MQLLVDAGATTKTAMLDQIIKADSIFLGEGKAILIEEFGKDYGIYFSILSAIARGKTSRSEIENVVGKDVYKRQGWISVSNCFRGTWVVGTPGSGKTFSIIEPRCV